MEFNFKLSVLLIGILFTGLTAGLCFTWSNAITPGIGRLDDLSFLKSFQAMNRAIINPSFLAVFFMPVIVLFVNAYLYRSADPKAFWSFMIAAVLFFVGIGLITVLKNVPLNEILDQAVLEDLNDVDLKALRTRFEAPWNRWHMLRTISSAIAFLLLITGLIYAK